MKKVLILFFLPVVGLAQKLPDFGISKVRLNEADKSIVAEIYPVQKQITAKSNKVYYWYSSNLIHSTQGGYSGKLLNGIYTEYYLNKNLKEQGVFKNGLKQGMWKTWNQEGTMTQSLNWDAGILSGNFEVYNNNGKLVQSGSYQDNLLNGSTRYYAGPDSGKIVYYRHGKILTEKPKPFWKNLPLLKRKIKQPQKL